MKKVNITAHKHINYLMNDGCHADQSLIIGGEAK